MDALPNYNSGAGTSSISQDVLALNTDFIRDQPTNLVMKGKLTSRDFTIYTHDETPVFELNADTFTTSPAKQIVDVRSGSEIITVRKKLFSSHSRYSAELPDGSGNKILEIETHIALLGSPTIGLTFQNAAKGGAKDQLNLVLHNFSRSMEVMWQDKQVAEIHHEVFSARGEYSLTISPRVDPLLIIVLAAAADDRYRQRRNVQ